MNKYLPFASRSVFALSHLLLLSFLFSGCATIWTKKHQNITIITHDSTARILVEPVIGLNVKTEGDSSTILVQRGIPQGVTINSPGTKPIHHAIIPTKRTPYFFIIQPLNILTLYAGFFVDFMAPRNKIFQNQYSFDLEPYRWEKPKDSLDKKIMCNGILSSPAFYPYYLVDYNPDSSVFVKNKEAALKRGTKSTYLRYKMEGQQESSFDPYASFNSEVNQNVLFYWEYTSLLNSHYYDAGFIDTVNLFFPDLNNTLFVSCYLTNCTNFLIDYGKNMRGLQSEVSGLWMIENAYGEILDTFSMRASSGTFPYKSVLNYSITPQLIDAFENLALKFDKSDELAAFKKPAPIQPKESLMTLPKPKPIALKKEALETIVRINNNGDLATGFAISTDGMVLTTYSNIASPRIDQYPNLRVITADGESHEAKVIRVDKAHNLAILQIEHVFEHAVNLEVMQPSKLFSDLVATCHADDEAVPSTLKMGILSSQRNQNNNDLLQLNMNFSAGNAGSPLFDEANEFQGVLVSNFFGELSEGISFAIPGNRIMEYLRLTY